MIPQRGRLLGSIQLACRVKPLQRPRLFTSARSLQRVYQPLENQRELRALMAERPPLGIDRAVIVDSYVTFKKSDRFELPASRYWGDEDNLRCAINNALQATDMILDDGLVLGGENMKLFGAEDSVEIMIYEVAA